MSYQRVLPRDLFNEANLLKCYGQLWLKLEHYMTTGIVVFDLVDSIEDRGFEVEQDLNSGDLTIDNITLKIYDQRWHLYRPLNSREPWPLYCFQDESNRKDIEVFTVFGELSPDFLTLLGHDDG